MGIVDEDVAAVRAASDIVSVISQYVQLRRVGRRWQGLCPFHAEKTPSFSVNAELAVYYCFGCHARGDIITFVEEMEHLDFPAAVEWLAPKAGVTLRYTDRHEGEGRKKRAKLIDVMTKAVAWYHDRLLSGPDAGAARKYLRERGLDGDVVRQFQIGWAPEGWDELCRALRLDERTARDTGLGRLNARNRLQDHFRARVMFPIWDDQGRPISFGGRILPGGERPGNQGKYQNTTETSLYNKSKVLYGLDRAKAAMVKANTAVVCEGYTDVIGFHRAGVPLAVATCGTALTDEHVRLLGRFAQRLVLAFDADGAGAAAAERFYRWEREHDLEVTVAELPPGQDPADLARSDPERLPAVVETARPFLRFRLDRVFAGAHFDTPEGRAKAAERGLAIVAEHPDPFVRDQYLMDVASRCRIEPERLRDQLARVGRRPQGRATGRRTGGRISNEPPAAGPPWDGRPDGPPGAASPPGLGHGDRWRAEPRDGVAADGQRPGGQAAAGWGEPGAPRSATGRRGAPPSGPALELLRHAVHDPTSVVQWLDEALFDDPLLVGVYQALIESDTYEDALATAPPPVADLLARLLVEEPASDPLDAVRRTLTETARREVRSLRLAGASDVADQDRALSDLAFLNRTIDALRKPDATMEVGDGLLAWLRQRVGDGG